MTNKELAVQLFTASLHANAAIASSPNFRGTVKSPTIDEMVSIVAELTEKLSQIKDE